MSVSLSEAWNDPPPDPPAQHAPAVSARPARVDDDPAGDDNNPDASPDKPSTPLPPPPPDDKSVAILEELRLLRIEESRRCTVYLAVGGVLFGLLFMYIDRLQQQIRSMNTFLYHRQMPTIAAVTQGLSSTPIQRAPPWLA